MNPITHALSGWCLAEAMPGLGRRERALIVIGAVAPDLDGFGLLPELLTRKTTHPLFWWTDYHHTIGHNVFAAIAMGGIAAVVAHRRGFATALLAFLAVHLHLLGDIIGARGPDGYQWPIAYLYPLRPDLTLAWKGQWALDAWQNVAITIVMLAVMMALAWRRGYSIVELISRRADAAFVGALRARFNKS